MFSGWHHGLAETDSAMTGHSSISMFDRSLHDTFTIKCVIVKCVSESIHWFSITAIFGKRSAGRQGTIRLSIRQERSFVERDDCNSKPSPNRIVIESYCIEPPPSVTTGLFESRRRCRK